MAKTARCDKCQIRWDVKIMDQTPLRELRCPYCCGQVKPVRSIGGPGLDYKLRQGEPEHGIPTWGLKKSTAPAKGGWAHATTKA